MNVSWRKLHRAKKDDFINNIGDTVEQFVDSWITKFKNGLVRVEEWDKAARQILEKLQKASNLTSNTESLKLVTNAWMKLSVLLKSLLPFDQDAHFPGFVQQACAMWWDSVTECQIKLACMPLDASRAMAAYIAAQLAFRRRDRGAALRWASLGYLADKLCKNSVVGGNEVTLRFGLGVPKQAVKMLEKHAAIGRRRKGIEGFPEWLLSEALADAHGISLVAPSELYSHHVCFPFVRVAAKHVFAKQGNTTKKGKRLEKFALYLVSTVPGIRPQRGFVALGQTAQHDVLATVLGDTPYPLPERATEWLIECKNWQSRISVEKVGHFLAKMQHSDAKFGIIIAKEGVSRDGDNAAKYAERFLTEFSMRERLVCLVIDVNDLKQLEDRGTFRGLIDEKYQKLRFGQSARTFPLNATISH